MTRGPDQDWEGDFHLHRGQRAEGRAGNLDGGGEGQKRAGEGEVEEKGSL